MRWRLKSPASPLFAQLSIQAQIKKKTSKLHVTGLCAGNSPVTGEFPTQKASNAESVSIWWRHDVSGRHCGSYALWQLVTHLGVGTYAWNLDYNKVYRIMSRLNKPICRHKFAALLNTPVFFKRILVKPITVCCCIMTVSTQLIQLTVQLSVLWIVYTDAEYSWQRAPCVWLSLGELQRAVL